MRRNAFGARLVPITAALACAALAVAGTVGAATADDPTSAPTSEPTSGSTSDPTETETIAPPSEQPDQGKIANAVLRWGINNESNNKAYAPGTWNFFSAGVLPNPGSGGKTIDHQSGNWKGTETRAWRGSAGNVRIDKKRADGTYGPATLSGLQTTPNGIRITNPSDDNFSDHQIVFSRGSGEIDRAKGTATITWSGSVSVAYYSGMSYFTLTNPTLTVTRKQARITATAGGFGSDINDLSKWEPLPRTKVVIAEIPRGKVNLSGKGIVATPNYLGVRYQASGDTKQVRSGSYWGSFPASFVRFGERAGSGAYWYSSGGAADRHKTTLPVFVSYSAGDPVPVPKISDADDQAEPEPTTPTQPTAPTPPPGSDSDRLDSPPPGSDRSPDPTPTAGTLPQAAPINPGLAEAPAVWALADAEERLGSEKSGHPWEWWLGSLLLLGAAAITLLNRFAKGRR